jgi:hypothetical protein
MTKQIVPREDGRVVIYYAFEEEPPARAEDGVSAKPSEADHE